LDVMVCSTSLHRQTRAEESLQLSTISELSIVRSRYCSQRSLAGSLLRGSKALRDNQHLKQGHLVAMKLISCHPVPCSWNSCKFWSAHYSTTFGLSSLPGAIIVVRRAVRVAVVVAAVGVGVVVGVGVAGRRAVVAGVIVVALESLSVRQRCGFVLITYLGVGTA